MWRLHPPSWAIPEEHCEIPVTGEPFVWFVGIFPTALVFPLLNLFWGAVIVKSRRWRLSLYWASLFLIWPIALWVDFSHHC